MKRKKSYKIFLTVLLCASFLLTIVSGAFLEMDERNHWSDGLYSFCQSGLAGKWMEKHLSRLSTYIVDSICEGETLNGINLPQGMGIRVLSDSGDILYDLTKESQSYVTAINIYLNTEYNQNAQRFTETHHLSSDADGMARLSLQGYLRVPVQWKDGAYWVYQIYQLLGERTVFEILLPVCGTLSLIFLALLLSSAGHSKKVSGIDVTGLHKIPFDILIVLTAGILLFLAVAYRELMKNSIESTEIAILFSLATAIVGFLLALFLIYTSAARLKAGTLISNTLIYRILSLLVNACKGIPFSWKGLLAGALLVGLNFLAGFKRDMIGIILVGALDAVALIALALLGSQLSELKDAGKELAKGNLLHTIDTSSLWPDLREHGTHLNQVGQNIQAAVSEQLKSDRFKTELITNVSHDLRTPLTNIVNYVDLLKKEDLPEGNAREYLDILDKQSQKLKKMTEDLIDASKASSGAITLSSEPIDLCEFVSQICGEYQERFAQANLSLLQQNPDQPVVALADGGQLSRVLENLLQNALKYSLTGTRVYLSLSKDPTTAYLELKNISKDPLGISAEELLERFVRGDASRSTEGSGLGLSIAQSLTELMGGKLSLSLDGDLFKVAVCLPLAQIPSN
ncbi:MAG: hypothetical protein IJ091_10245 [Oscillospiraceae bacterium]|nr:hypothetical protein [Oscillospiraceae bacterium]